MSLPDIEAVRAALKNLLNTSPDPLTREQFDRLTPRDQACHCRHGGRIVNGGDAPAQSPRLAILDQNQYSKLSAKDRGDYTKFGGLIRDNGTPAPTPRPSPDQAKKEGIAFND